MYIGIIKRKRAGLHTHARTPHCTVALAACGAARPDVAARFFASVHCAPMHPNIADTHSPSCALS